MNAKPRPWSAISDLQRLEQVKPLLDQGDAYSTIAWRVGAPSRSAVAGLVTRMRAAGKLPPAAPKEAEPEQTREQSSKQQHKSQLRPVRKHGGIVGGKPGKALREARAQTFLPQNIANKAESRKNDPGLTISRAAAWDPLDGVEPITLLDLTEHTCKWPVDADTTDPRQFFCGAPCDLDVPYCDCHAALGSGGYPRSRTGSPANT